MNYALIVFRKDAYYADLLDDLDQCDPYFNYASVDNIVRGLHANVYNLSDADLIMLNLKYDLITHFRIINGAWPPYILTAYA